MPFNVLLSELCMHTSLEVLDSGFWRSCTLHLAYNALEDAVRIPDARIPFHNVSFFSFTFVCACVE